MPQLKHQFFNARTFSAIDFPTVALSIRWVLNAHNQMENKTTKPTVSHNDIFSNVISNMFDRYLSKLVSSQMHVLRH